MSDNEDIHRSRSPSPARINPTSTGYYNPGLTLDDNDVSVDLGVVGNGLDSNYASDRPTTSALPSSAQTWERFDDDDDNPAMSAARDDIGQKRGENGHMVGNEQKPAQHQNGGALTKSIGHPASAPHNTPADSAPVMQHQTVTSHPVHYDRAREQAVVQNGVVGGGGGVAEGGAVIITRSYPEYWRDLPQRPLTARHMKLLKIFSIVAVVLFFPSGVPAAYFAFRSQREFDEGIMRGNIDRAQKFARRAQHLIILSVVLAVMTAVLVFAMVERAQRGHDETHSFVAHNTFHG